MFFKKNYKLDLMLTNVIEYNFNYLDHYYF